MILALLACKPPIDIEPVGTNADVPLIQAVRRQEMAGFLAQEGRLQPFGGCDDFLEELGQCGTQNTATPYVSAYFDRFDDPIGSLTLRPDQAILFVGRTPPPSLYFSLGTAVHERTYEDGRLIPSGSISASLHHQHILHGGDTPFDAPFVTIATANRSLANRVRRDLAPLLASTGVPQRAVNLIEIPFLTDAELDDTADSPAYEDVTVVDIRLGEAADDDRLSFTWRVAGADTTDAFFDPEQIPQGVFRLTPKTAVDHDPWTYPLLPPVRDNEALPPPELRDALVTVSDALAAEVESRGLRHGRLPFGPNVFDGFECVEEGILCGNSDDALYISSDPVWIDPEATDAGIFVIGVLHPDVPDLGAGGPRLAYSHFQVLDSTERRGLSGWLHTELRGTAAARFPDGVAGVDTALLNRLFIREFSRDCNSDDCFTLDTPPEHTINFQERAYLDLGSGTGPHGSTVFPARMLLYGPRVRVNVDEDRFEILE